MLITREVINQPTNQPISQSVSQSISQSANHQSINQFDQGYLMSWGPTGGLGVIILSKQLVSHESSHTSGLIDEQA